MNIPKSIKELENMSHEQLGDLHRYCLDQQDRVLESTNDNNIDAQLPKMQMLDRWIKAITKLRIDKTNADAAAKRAAMGV